MSKSKFIKREEFKELERRIKTYVNINVIFILIGLLIIMAMLTQLKSQCF